MAYMNPRLILLLLLALVATTGVSQVCAQQSGTRVALVIGNADYPDAEAPLKELLNNTRAFADELKRQGFEVDVGENLTKEAMRAAIERFHGKIKSGSTALIFFSGYGLQSSRQTYIVPVNAQIWTEADVRRDGFNLNSILAEMNSKGARVKIAILDASRRNPFERRFRTVPAGLAPVIAPNNTAVMYAAAPSMVVRDGDRSLFVTELLKEIRSPGKIEEVFNRTLSSVSRESRGEQAPWFSSSLVEEFSFVPGRPDTSPAPRPDADADARREYQSAERTGTRKAWEDFLARYPSGRYSDLARDRLAKLDPAPAPRPDSDADVRREYQSAERIGTRKAWEDFLAKVSLGALSRPRARPARKAGSCPGAQARFRRGRAARVSSPRSASERGGRGRISSQSIPRGAIPISRATGLQSWILLRRPGRIPVSRMPDWTTPPSRTSTGGSSAIEMTVPPTTSVASSLRSTGTSSAPSMISIRSFVSIPRMWRRSTTAAGRARLSANCSRR